MNRFIICISILMAPSAMADETKHVILPPRLIYVFAETQFWGPYIPASGSIGTELSRDITTEYSFFYLTPFNKDENEDIYSIYHTARLRYFPSKNLTLNLSAGWSLTSNNYKFSPSYKDKTDTGLPSKAKPYKVNVLKTGPEFAIGNWWQWGNFSLRFDWVGANIIFDTSKKSGPSAEQIEGSEREMSRIGMPHNGVNIILARSGIGLSF